MKKLFLSSYFAAVYKMFPDFANENCAGKTVTFVAAAAQAEKITFYIDTAKKAFKKLGIIVDELDITQTSKEKITEIISRNDYIYVSGGNTFYLLQELIKSGADQIIMAQIRSGKIYIGESAGSVVISKNIEYSNMIDDPGKAELLDNYEALSIIDFYPVPHHTNFPFKKVVDKTIQKYHSSLDLRPMSNKQVLTVSGEQVDLVG